MALIGGESVGKVIDTNLRSLINVWLAVVILLTVTASPVRGQELSILGGGMKPTAGDDGSYAWQIEYLHGLGEHVGVSLSYLNEGHVPDHHRDGISLQLWRRINLYDRRLSLAVGVGPYFYFDTTGNMADGTFRDKHDWKGMASMSATWYLQNRLLLEFRTNWVVIGNNFDSVSALAGIGYQLDPPASPGPLDKATQTVKKITGNELTLFLGKTIVNSFESESSIATSFEYRYGLFRHVDWTVAWLYEGNNHLRRRNGLTTQLWGVREFLNDRLAIGVGAGAYFALDHYSELLQGNVANRTVSGIVSLTGSYRFHPDWDVRATWNRVVTNYSSDTDVILGGIGYRF
jgi:hypothetical protein